mmetsp:Transcript_3034/g.7689  ORF Transcript_3034/g.7689 Transcript_3034/m.7689 type:complete len:505 (+) Transcript_3034:1102-2616(+)
MLHRILHQLLEITLDVSQTTNIIPRNIWHLHHSLSQTTGVTHAQSMPKVILIHRHAIQNFGINLLILNINQIHLLANALHGGFGTERSNICSDKAVGLASNGLGVDILVQLHVTGVDAEHLQPAIFIGDANVDFAVEPSETAEGGIHRVGAVGGANDHHARALLQPVHEGQHLTHDAPLDLTVGLLALGSDGIDLVDEDDGGGVLLRLLERLAEIGFGLSRHLGHDFGSVDEEEEGSRLVGHRTGDEGLTGSRGTVEEHSAGRLDAQGLEEGRVAEGEFDHLANLGHLLAASPHVVVPDVVHLLLVLAFHGLSLAVDDGVRGHDAVGGGIRLHDLEFDGVHGRADQEQVSLFHGTVRLQKVRLEVDVEQVAGHALDGIVQWEDVHALPVRDVPTIRHGDDVGESHAEIFAHDLVHSDGGVVAGLVGEDDADRIAALLSLDEDRVAAEEGELLHFGGGEGDDGVVVVRGIVDDEAVGRPLLAQDGVFHVGVFIFGLHHFGITDNE